MAQLQVYNAGLASWSRWESGSFKLALLTGGTFNRDHDHVDDMATANRVTVSGYADIAPDTPTLTVDNATDRTSAAVGAHPNFGSLAAGETVTALLVYEFVTDDAGSIPMGWLDLTPTATDAIDPFVVTLTGLAVARYIAGSGS